jgi:hypothetical protein
VAKNGRDAVYSLQRWRGAPEAFRGATAEVLIAVAEQLLQVKASRGITGHSFRRSLGVLDEKRPSPRGLCFWHEPDPIDAFENVFLGLRFIPAIHN